MADLDRAEADELSLTPKVITQRLTWEAESVRQKLNVRVLAPELNKVLELRGVVGKTNRSFTLLFQNLPIRRYDNQGVHTEPDGKKVAGPHKHTWDKVYRDAYTYKPSDIDPAADVNNQLLQFLKEQNIQLDENYQHILNV